MPEQVEIALGQGVMPGALCEMGFWARLPSTIRIERPGISGWQRLREHLLRFLDDLQEPVISVTRADVQRGSVRHPLAERDCPTCSASGAVHCAACDGSGKTDAGEMCPDCLGSSRAVCSCVKTYTFPIPPRAVSGYLSRGTEEGGKGIRYANLTGPDLQRRLYSPEWWITSVLALLSALPVATLPWLTHDWRKGVAGLAVSLLVIVGGILALVRRPAGWLIIGVWQAVTAVAWWAGGILGVVGVALLPTLDPWLAVILSGFALVGLALLSIPLAWSFRWWMPVVKGCFFPLQRAHRCFSARVGATWVRVTGWLFLTRARWAIPVVAAFYLFSFVLALAVPSVFRLGQAWVATLKADYVNAIEVSATALETDPPRPMRRALGQIMGVGLTQAATEAANEKNPERLDRYAGAIARGMEQKDDLPESTADRMPDFLGALMEHTLDCAATGPANQVGKVLESKYPEHPITQDYLYPPDREWRFLKYTGCEEKDKILSETHGKFDSSILFGGTEEVYSTAAKGKTFLLLSVDLLHVGKGERMLYSSLFAARVDGKPCQCLGMVVPGGYVPRVRADEGGSPLGLPLGGSSDGGDLVTSWDGQLVFEVPKERKVTWLNVQGRSVAEVKPGTAKPAEKS